MTELDMSYFASPEYIKALGRVCDAMDDLWKYSIDEWDIITSAFMNHDGDYDNDRVHELMIHKQGEGIVLLSP